MSTNKSEVLSAPSLVEIAGTSDWLLQGIIETVINRGVDIGVTLTIGGSVVSGILIGGSQYFDLLADSFLSASKEDGDIAEILGESYRLYKDIYKKPDNVDEKWEAPRPTYLHLKNARFYAPGYPAIPANGILWRGKISSVDAFSIGNFES